MRRHVRSKLWHRVLGRLGRGGRARAWAEDGARRHQTGVNPRAHQGPRLGRFRGPRAGNAGEEKTVAYLTAQFQKMGLKPGNPDGHVRSKRSSGRLSGQAGDGSVSGRQPRDRAVVSQRFRGRLAPAGRRGECRKIGRRLRGLWSGRPGIRLGRLQGSGRSREDLDHAGQRPSRRRPQRPLQARPGFLQRPGHDLLRALDLQV